MKSVRKKVSFEMHSFERECEGVGGLAEVWFSRKPNYFIFINIIINVVVIVTTIIIIIAIIIIMIIYLLFILPAWFVGIGDRKAALHRRAR